jgi:secondary thiamine-phosphate synthase enzyme
VFEQFVVETTRETQSVDLTERVREIVVRSGAAAGLCHVMVMHSTAAIVVNETADPNIGADVQEALGRAVPSRGDWLHDRIDDNAAAHIKASILGPSEILPVRAGVLALGTWQGIWLLEFDGPRKRTVSVQILTGAA